MIDVRIERFHARFHQVTAQRGVELDRALADLVADRLDGALAEALGSEASRAWAICLPLVTVEVTLGETGAAVCATAWADAVAAAVRDALEGGASSGSSSGVSAQPCGPVVFATLGDALVDLVRRAALGDPRHVWAWRQSGLLRGGGRGRPDVDRSEVVAVLRGQPLLVPGVLRRVGPELFGRVVPPADVVELASLVAATVAIGHSPRSLPLPGSVPSDGVAVGVDGRRAVEVEASIAALPGQVRDWIREAPPSDRAVVALAALATLTARPLCSGDPAFLAAVAARLRDARPDSDAAPVPTQAPPPAAEVVPAEVVTLELAPTAAADEGEPTVWGGVWFLVHGLTATVLAGTAPSPSPAELARLVSAFTGAPDDDVAVRHLCGLYPDDPPEPDLQGDPGGLVALTEWLNSLAGGRLVDPERDVPWRRRATIRRHPGEIEVELSLDEVDPVVRAAGLDLDPGWVGWLATFVRFRYV